MLSGNAVESAQMTLGLIPEILNTVYVVSTLCKQVRVIDTNMVKIAHIEYVITLQ